MYGAASHCDGIQGLALDVGKIGVFTAQGKGGSKRGIWQTNSGGYRSSKTTFESKTGWPFPGTGSTEPFLVKVTLEKQRFDHKQE